MGVKQKLRVFESRVLRRIFGPKGNGGKGGWRKLHNEEMHNFYSSPSIIRIIKSRGMKGATCGTNWGEEEHVQVIGRKARGKETTRKTKT
jgi:hypothetical protein